MVVEFTEPNIVFKFTQTGCGYSVWVRFWDEKRKRKYAVTQFFLYRSLELFARKYYWLMSNTQIVLLKNKF